VLDVREPEEGPLAGDRRLPFSRAAELLDTLDPGQSYLLVCASGQRSYTLARELARRGVTAWSLEGGVKALGSHAA
jgi:rhodanese-related sulfurtransferase